MTEVCVAPKNGRFSCGKELAYNFGRSLVQRNLFQGIHVHARGLPCYCLTLPTCHAPPPCVQVYKLPAERLYATYFGGDASQGLPADDEAKSIWLRFLPQERVLPFGCKVCGVKGVLTLG